MIEEIFACKDLIKIFLAIVVLGGYWLGKGICFIGKCVWGLSIYDSVGQGWRARLLIWGIGVFGFVILLFIVKLLSSIISTMGGACKNNVRSNDHSNLSSGGEEVRDVPEAAIKAPK